MCEGGKEKGTVPESFGRVTTTPPPLTPLFCAYSCHHITSPPARDHIRTLSGAGALSSTLLSFDVFFSFYSGPFFPPVNPLTTTSPFKSHSKHPLSALCDCLYPPIGHQQVGVLDMQTFLTGWRSPIPC